MAEPKKANYKDVLVPAEKAAPASKERPYKDAVTKEQREHLAERGIQV